MDIVIATVGLALLIWHTVAGRQDPLAPTAPDGASAALRPTGRPGAPSVAGAQVDHVAEGLVRREPESVVGEQLETAPLAGVGVARHVR